MKEQKDALEKIVAAAEYPEEQAINVMMAIQEKAGYLSDEAMKVAAEIVGVSPTKLEEIATFYNYLYREPVGKYVINVCDSVLCWLDGGVKILDYLSEKLGIAPGQTTPDGMYTLLPANCIGCCDKSPAMLINKEAYGNLTLEKIDEIFNDLNSGE